MHFSGAAIPIKQTIFQNKLKRHRSNVLKRSYLVSILSSVLALDIYFLLGIAHMSPCSS